MPWRRATNCAIAPLRMPRVDARQVYRNPRPPGATCRPRASEVVGDAGELDGGVRAVALQPGQHAEPGERQVVAGGPGVAPADAAGQEPDGDLRPLASPALVDLGPCATTTMPSHPPTARR